MLHFTYTSVSVHMLNTLLKFANVCYVICDSYYQNNVLLRHFRSYKCSFAACKMVAMTTAGTLEMMDRASLNQISPVTAAFVPQHRGEVFIYCTVYLYMYTQRL